MRQGAADARSVEISRGLGRGLKDARLRSRLTQAAAADLAGLAQSTWSAAELGKGENYTVETWTRMARAVGSDLNAYLSRATAADRPRDEVHLRHQELLIRTATAGGWGATFEAPLGDPLHGSRSADTLLRRGPEIAIIEIFDWFDDVGAAARAWDRKVARVEARALSRPQTDEEAESLRVGGCWVVRATRRNRELVGARRAVLRLASPDREPGCAP